MVMSCVTSLLASVSGHYVNSINFLGVDSVYDSEAEFRLVQLGKSIVEAKRVSLDVSMSLKDSYAASIQDKESRHASLTQALAHSTNAKEAWANVAKDFRNTCKWLEGKLRKDYSQAFVEAATVGNLHSTFVERGVSNDYMASAFENVCVMCEEDTTPEQSVLGCLRHLAEQAEKCAEETGMFTLYLEELQKVEDFSLYGYIFDHLALRAEKPRLFELDEAYFAAQNEFEITYEAVEQIARHAHTIVPGTHDQSIEFFDLRFTE